MRISDWSSDVCSSDLVLAQKNLARERQLYEQKVSARVDYEQAQAEAAAATAEARRAQVAASAANITRDGGGAIVASPISGRVTAESGTLGAFVQPATELFRGADPATVPIEAADGQTAARSEERWIGKGGGSTGRTTEGPEK